MNPHVTFTPPSGLGGRCRHAIQRRAVPLQRRGRCRGLLGGILSGRIDTATFVLNVHVGVNSGCFVGMLSAQCDTTAASTSVDLPIVTPRRRAGPR
jgi:hypothetical protein